MHKLYNVSVLIVFLSIQLFMCAKVLIFDIGGVLFDPDKIGVARHIGLSHFISYALWDRKNPNVQQLVFQTLDKIDQVSNQKTNYKAAGTAEGDALPAIMSRWQAGQITGPEIIEKVKQSIPRLEREQFFSSKREQVLVQRTINAMFNPHVLAHNITPIKEGIALARDCARARSYDGSQLNQIIIFSNWDELSFKPFYKKFQHIFNKLGAVIISAHIKRIKPHKKAFRYLLKKYRINPHECILIDDQKINVKAAHKCGIQSIWFKNRDFKKLRHMLIKLGALTK